MEIAAWCPCSTAQMMFSGPHAASPPANTPGREVMKVLRSTTGMSHSLNSMPMSRSIQGNAVSCPMARITSSHSMILLPSFSLRIRPPSPSVQRTTSNSMAISFPFSTTNRAGE